MFTAKGGNPYLNILDQLTGQKLTFPTMFVEGGGEFTGELCHRQDLIRFGYGLIEATLTLTKPSIPTPKLNFSQFPLNRYPLKPS